MHMGSTSTDNIEEAEVITHMDPSLYNAAAEGYIDALKDKTENLHLLLTPNKNTVLHVHIISQCGEMESTHFVEKILDMRPSLLLQANAIGEIPLHMAARYGCSGTVKVLIERAKAPHEVELEGGVGATRHMLRMTNKEKDTALHEAVRFNHLGVVKLLTKEDPEFSYSANDAGETPLYLAAERGLRDLVSQILHYCTSPAHGGPNALTALHAAVIRNDNGITRDILEVKGADLTKEADQQGWTPLHYAAHLGHVSMVELLLEYDISAAYLANRDGNRTALHIAAHRRHSNIMKILISRCPDCCELVDKRGWNVLHYAVESKDLRTVEVVLKNSRLTNFLNQKDNEGNTPLHRLAASVFDSPILVQDPRVDKMAFNKENRSALDISFANDQMSSEVKGIIVGCLKEAGARAGQRNITYEDDVGEVKEGKDITTDQIFNQMMKAQQTHLIVATLIATVTFAAGFTLPGGYISNENKDQGTAILTKKAAFRAFVISDTIAMVLSSSSVFIHLFLALNTGKKRDGKFVPYFSLAFTLTISAMGAMVVAFMMGLYAVLEHSSGLRIAICVIAGCFFFFYYYLFAKPFRMGIRTCLG